MMNSEQWEASKVSKSRHLLLTNIFCTYKSVVSLREAGLNLCQNYQLCLEEEEGSMFDICKALSKYSQENMKRQFVIDLHMGNSLEFRQ